MNDNDRCRLTVENLTCTFNPTTVTLAIDDTEHPTTLTVTGTGPYTVAATTLDYFAGPAHPAPSGATVLGYGIHTAEARVNASDGTTLTRSLPSFRIR